MKSEQISTPISLRRDGALATITLNQPAKRNAISAAMWQALPRLVEEVENDRELCLLIVRGAVGAFSAGADISEFPQVYATPESSARYNDDVRKAQAALAGLSKPSVAAIDGVCVGGGCGVALCCDIRIASHSSRFGITPARLGIAYSFADTKRLVDAVGPAHAKHILFSGQILDADKALAIGLINDLIEPAQFEDHVHDYAAHLTEMSQYTIRTAKAVVDAVMADPSGPSEALQQQVRGAFVGEDFREGYQAFNERRRPQFRWR